MAVPLWSKTLVNVFTMVFTMGSDPIVRPVCDEELIPSVKKAIEGPSTWIV